MTSLIRESIYTNYILKNVPRVLTQVDRDKDSKTYGSCDRNYWHLKIRDFSSAILQQTCLTMALLFNVEFEGNVYYQNPNLRDWSVAALKYMGKIQLRDGSFNEYYPNEHGFPPTAFNLFAACKTYMELNLNDKVIILAMEKSANWLSKHQELKAYNQEIAAIAGIYLLYKITGKKEFLNVVNRRVDALIEKQSEEGWFPEQGGADIGYSSVAFDMLTEYYAASGDERVQQPICRLQKFLSHFVHPDGTIGGEYGSRNTIYFMPNGLETFISLGLDNDHSAKSMVQKIYKESSCSVYGDFMDSVDERYLSHYVLHSYLRALKQFKEREKVEVVLPCNTLHTQIFKDSGLITYYNGEYYCVISGYKGGIIKVYKGNREIFWDCGYRIRIKSGTIATTNWLDTNYEIEYGTNICRIKGIFNKVTPKMQTPVYHLGLRISALLMGDKVNRLIKKVTIFQNKHYDALFERMIILEKHQIIIKDIIENPQGLEIEEAGNISLRLVASGKFFSRSDILRNSLKSYGNAKKLTVKRIFDIEKEKINDIM